ncbi:MAG: riboflavin biosynthesis protein RibF [candidate division WOR-3 bacterium]
MKKLKIQKIEFPYFPSVEKPPVLIPGNFDGVHRGHRILIEEGRRISKILKTNLVVLFFEPHPYLFFHKNRNNFLLTTLEEKIEILKSLKVNEVWILNFDEKLAETSPEIFADKLLNLEISRLILGPDHTFGKDKKGNIFTMVEIAREKGKVLTIFPFITYKNRKISSTRIRELIEKGEIEEANTLLGYNFFINGTKIKGSGRGKKLGFPTINLKISELKIKPKEGVYIVETEIKNKTHQGLLYYGSRPTFNEKEKVFEVYLFNFNGEFKKKNLKVKFHKFIRNDMKFDSVEELKKQIEKDINIGYTYFLKKGSNPD